MNSLWYERLGETYHSCDEIDDAVTCFKKAQSFSDSSYKAAEGLAQCLGLLKQFDPAISTLRSAMIQLQREDNLQESERTKRTFQGWLQIAQWHNELNHYLAAMDCYGKAFFLKYDDDEVCCCVIKSLVATGQDNQLRQSLSEMMGRKASSSNTTQVISVLQRLVEDPDYGRYFQGILTVTSGTALFEDVIDQMKIGYEIAEKEGHVTYQAILMLYYGLARYHYDTSPSKNPAVAKEIWEQCSDLSRKDRRSWKLAEVYQCSVVWLALFHYRAAVSRMDQYHVKSLESIVKDNENSSFSYYDHKIYLTCYYAHVVKNKEKARGTLLKELKEGLDWLSDDEDWNDNPGYFRLGDVFAHTGDDLDALSALSMLRPKDAGTRHLNKSPEAKGRADFYFYCDGMCGETWQYADDCYCCKLCSSQLCNKCLAEVKGRTIRRFVCSADHEWLHIPPWDDNEYLKVGPKNVLIGGELVNGARVGGRVVSLEEWLNIIRDDWNIPRAQEKESENDGPVGDLAYVHEQLAILKQLTGNVDDVMSFKHGYK